ncbi:NAD(P)-binding protein [Oricola indica]|uniref:NAD(P)-binding protein n=1 Tax=Oricola indica TaxID=2872591 RepID=UPI003CCC2E54
MPDRSKDVVIVGAGIAGLYCAWRLLRSGMPAEHIAIFETSTRQGGRIHTAAWPQDPSIRFETGAHYINGAHTLANTLARSLGLSLLNALFGELETLVSLRGKCLSQREIRRSRFRKPFPYDIGGRWQRRSPRRLLEQIAVRGSGSAFSGPIESLPGRAPEAMALNTLLEDRLGADGLQFICDRVG